MASFVEPINREPRVIIAIVSTKDARHIVGCLESLAALTHRNFGVVIWENGGAEAFEQLAGTLADLNFISELDPASRDTIQTTTSSGDVRDFVLTGGQAVTALCSGENLGYAGGVNACIHAIPDGPWDAVWVLNPDTFPDPDALAALVRHHSTGDYGIVGSRLLGTSNGLVQTWGGQKWRHWLGGGICLGRDMPGETTPDVAEIERSLEFISGASMYVSRAYIEAVGVMDDDFFVYCEDVDWGLRHGSFKLGYAHDSIVHHIGGGTSGTASRFSIYLNARNLVLLARKRHLVKWPIIAAVTLNKSLAEQLIIARSFRRSRYVLEGWWAGIRGERGAPYFI